ncbi:MAG TPA: hypothetical protein ENH28_02590, partial [Euryarchaeota archaeon]|nr:hypothetical protein [Euryarchaeota archaeon]
SVLVSGGTATGKTTFLNVLSIFITPDSKIVSIEDTAELNIPHEHWIPAVARPGYGTPDSMGRRYGEVTMFDILKSSLRQRPDYIIVGEVRGAEAYVLFQGMANRTCRSCNNPQRQYRVSYKEAYNTSYQSLSISS